jgi:hypothetical protein
MIIIATPTKFPLGQIVITANAASKVSKASISSGLQRHSQCDWGDICKDDAALNDEAVTSGDRLLSSYRSEACTFWIITEADRSVTTVLLPEDY